MDFGICPTKTGDVRLISRFIEPAEHGVKLFTQDEPDEGHRKFLKLHRLAQDAAEDLGGLGVGQLAAGDLQLFSDEFGWALESQGYKRADVVCRYGLVRFVSPDGIGQLAFQEADLDLVDVVRLHECGGPDHGGRQTQTSNVFFDFPLALPVGNAGVALRPANGAVDKVFDTCFFCRVRYILALLNFPLCANRPKVLDAVNAIDACGRPSDRSCILQVTLDELHALACQRLGGVALRVASQGSQLPTLWQHVADNRAALAAGSPRHEHSPTWISHTRSPPFVFVATCPPTRETSAQPTETQSESNPFATDSSVFSLNQRGIEAKRQHLFF